MFACLRAQQSQKCAYRPRYSLWNILETDGERANYKLLNCVFL
jgi:hypothetical protein